MPEVSRWHFFTKSGYLAVLSVTKSLGKTFSRNEISESVENAPLYCVHIWFGCVCVSSIDNNMMSCIVLYKNQQTYFAMWFFGFAWFHLLSSIKWIDMTGNKKKGLRFERNVSLFKNIFDFPSTKGNVRTKKAFSANRRKQSIRINWTSNMKRWHENIIMTPSLRVGHMPRNGKQSIHSVFSSIRFIRTLIIQTVRNRLVRRPELKADTKSRLRATEKKKKIKRINADKSDTDFGYFAIAGRSLPRKRGEIWAICKWYG